MWSGQNTFFGAEPVFDRFNADIASVTKVFLELLLNQLASQRRRAWAGRGILYFDRQLQGDLALDESALNHHRVGSPADVVAEKGWPTYEVIKFKLHESISA